ncbi:MAG: DUF975 family protein [Blautia sp.]|jgi:uncharacterized membrane protein
MKYKIKQLKAMARESLHGKYGIAIAALLLFGLLNIFVNFLTVTLFQDSGTLTTVISWLFSFILSLIMCIFSAGLDYIYLNIARHKETRASDLFYMFNHHPDRAIIAGFFITVISTIASLPTILMPAHLMTDMQNGSMEAFGIAMSLIFLSLVLTTILCVPFSFTYFLLVDSPDMEAKDALKGSFHMAGKNLGRILYLEVSFLGLSILSLFTLYIALLWIIPYIQTTLAFLYLECSGELAANTPSQTAFATQTAPGAQSEIPSVSEPKDDLNSEA